MVIDTRPDQHGFGSKTQAFEASTRDRRKDLDPVTQFILALCAVDYVHWQDGATISRLDAEVITLRHHSLLPLMKMHHRTFKDCQSTLPLCLVEARQAYARQSMKYDALLDMPRRPPIGNPASGDHGHVRTPRSWEASPCPPQKPVHNPE
jgi:hypothetical protein